MESLVKEHKGQNLKEHIDLLVKDIIDELSSYLPNKEQLTINFVNNIKYKRSVQGKDLICYIFKKYNENCGSTGELDYSNIHLEHILPQNPEKAWGDPLNDKTKIRDFVDSIGNLTLSEPLNRAARNKTLDIKKPQYLSSEIKMTNDDLIEFINQNDQKWDEKIIKTRSKI